MEYLIKLSQIRFEDTKGVIKGQNTDIQNTILSNMNRTKIKKMLGMISSSCSTGGTRHVTLHTNLVISHA